MKRTSSSSSPDIGAISAGVGAFFLWGLLPIYWKLLKAAPAWEILGHRIFWSAVFAGLMVSCGAGWSGVRAALGDRRTCAGMALCSLLIAFNWGLYIWAVNAGYVLQGSLGYFIAPLLAVLLGVVVLGERLRRMQAIAIGLIVIAVAWLTWQSGQVPWIALLLATSFSLYSLSRKKIKIHPIDGLFLEAIFLTVPALIYLGSLEARGIGSFGHGSMGFRALLIFSGAVTGLPLILFTTAVRRLDLTLMGILQYLSPTCQFLLAVFVYNEALGIGKLCAFFVIWTAVALYLGDAIRGGRKKRGSKAKQKVTEEII